MNRSPIKGRITSKENASLSIAFSAAQAGNKILLPMKGCDGWHKAAEHMPGKTEKGSRPVDTRPGIALHISTSRSLEKLLVAVVFPTRST